MAKRYDEQIEVSTTADDATPLSFTWRGRRYYVDERLSSWREGGRWWHSERAVASASAQIERNAVYEREFFRVVAHQAGMGGTGELDPDGFVVTCSSVYDICLDRIKGIWLMARLWD
ncbi:MAG TPA: DUF6504 family protein [Actinomycetota bacterium]|nr:DUF6504 family protein [Actinomycetota bacterium]